MKLSEFDFELPEELIAQHPVEKRDTSRLMVVNRENGNIEHRHFYDILDYLKPGDVLVRNNTKVIPARLFGIKEETNGHVEVLLLKELKKDTWECLCGNARIIKMNTVITFGEGLLKAKCIEIKDEGIRVFEMMYDGIFYEILDQLGTMPLPPYIKEKLEDKNRYQTVYAKIEGSAAAPTAGLHFTEEINQKIKDKGIEILDVCLHVGLGTFRPVKEENVLDHHMHSEFYQLSEEAAATLRAVKASGHRVIACGTTSIRTLETIGTKFDGDIQADSGWTDIFIKPGYQWKVVDAFNTNFHLPKSTLVMLVAAFAGQDFILEAYQHAIDEHYRFFSFGDAMFVK